MLLLDGAEGTRKIGAQAAADGLLGLSGGAKVNGLTSVSSSFSFTEGWFRIIETLPNSYPNYTVPRCLDIMINRTWLQRSPEIHRIMLVTCSGVLDNSGKIYFIPILNTTNSFLIKKIRSYIIKKEDNTYFLSVDIKLDLEHSKRIHVIVNNSFQYDEVSKIILPNKPSPIEENITTYSDIFEHTFLANSIGYNNDTWPLS